MGQRIDGVELFAAGTWMAARGGKTVVTEGDLDAMVATYAELSSQVEGYRPVVKLGHADNQRLFGRDSGAPNFGFVENVRKVGAKVVADLVNLPDALFEMIRARRYNQLSIEAYPKVQYAGREFNWALTAVALLGAELPAVKGLKELASLLMSECPFEGELQEFCEMTYTQEQLDAAVAEAVAKATEGKVEASELDAAKGELETARTELATTKETLATVEGARDAALTRATGAEEALRTFTAEARTAKIAGLVDAAIKDGKVLPKDREATIAMGERLAGELKFGEQTVDGIEHFGAFLGGLGKVVALGEEKGQGGGAKEFGSAQEEVSHLITERMTGSKCSYAEAYQHVMSTIEPSLKARYVAGE